MKLRRAPETLPECLRQRAALLGFIAVMFLAFWIFAHLLGVADPYPYQVFNSNPNGITEEGQ